VTVFVLQIVQSGYVAHLHPDQRIPGALSPGINWPRHAADRSPHIVPMLTLSGVTPPFTHIPS
jgi:hypothetical protein